MISTIHLPSLLIKDDEPGDISTELFLYKLIINNQSINQSINQSMNQSIFRVA